MIALSFVMTFVTQPMEKQDSTTKPQVDAPTASLSEAIPDFIIEYICQFLDLHDIVRLKKTCKRFRYVWNNNKEIVLWTKSLRDKFPAATLDESIAALAHRLVYRSDNQMVSCFNPIMLDLSFQKDLVIPQAMGQLVNIETLNLSNNKLTQDQLKNICRLTPRVVTLKLCNCALEKLPEEIASLTQLKQLFLDKNKINDQALADVCQRTPRLKLLSIGHNKLRTVPQEIGQLRALTCLFLQGNSLTQQALDTIAAHAPTIEFLNMNACNLDTIEQLRTLKQLKDLDVSDNQAIPDAAIEALREQLPTTTITGSQEFV